MPEPDYAALATQFGGTYVPPSSTTATAPSSTPDYESLAKQFGGTYVPPTAQKPDPRAQSKIEARTPGLWETVSGIFRQGAAGEALYLDDRTAEEKRLNPDHPILRFEAAAPQEGAIRGASKFLSSLTTPENISIMAATGGLGNIESAIGKTGLAKLVGLGFSASMIDNAAKQTPGFIDAVSAKDWPKAREIGTQAVLGLLMAAHGARYGGTNEDAVIPNTTLPRRTPAPPVDLMGGRTTLPTPEALADTAINATRSTASALSKAATRKIVNSSLVKADPKLGITNVYGAGIDPRVAKNFEETRKDILTHGGPVESNQDIFKQGNAAKDKLDSVLDAEWMQPARDREQEYDLAPLIQATQDAIPYVDQQANRGSAQEEGSSEGKQVVRILSDVRKNYAGRKVNTDQMKLILEGLNAKVGKIYKMNAGDRAAAEGQGAPLAILEAQAEAARQILYEGLDPDNAGAGPQEIQRRIGNITGLMQEADKAKVKIDLEKPISKAGVGGKLLSAAVSLPGKKIFPALATADAAKGSVLHPIIGPTDALIKRLFMDEARSKGIPIPPIPEDPNTRLPVPPLNEKGRYPNIPTANTNTATTPPPVGEQSSAPFKSAAESAQIFTSAPPYSTTARKSAQVFEPGPQSPIIPETGVSENVARRQAAREEASRLLDVKWEDLNNPDRNVIDDLIDKGEAGSAQPPKPVLKPKPTAAPPIRVMTGGGVKITVRPPAINRTAVSQKPAPVAAEPAILTPDAPVISEPTTIPARSGETRVGKGSPVFEPRPAGNPVGTGKATVVKVPNEPGNTYDAEYEVRELADIHPSHSGHTFEENPAYQIKNERNYKDPVNQKLVMENSGSAFDPDYLINDNPTATNGPPVIDANGNVYGGNSRAMTLQRVYRNNTEAAARYRQSMIEKAEQVGVDPKSIAGMREPVLVRRFKNSEVLDSDKAVTDFNKKETKSLTSAEQATSDARAMTPQAHDYLTSILDNAGPETSLAEILSSDTGHGIVRKLIDEGVFSEAEAGGLLDSKTKAVTQQAKDRISKMLIGDFFRDSEQLQRAPLELKAKLERIAAPVTGLQANPAWDIKPVLREAIDVIEYANNTGVRYYPELVQQTGMFNEPPKFSADAIMVAQALSDMGPINIGKAFREYASDSRPGLFRDVTREQALQEAFGSALKLKPRSNSKKGFTPAPPVGAAK